MTIFSGRPFSAADGTPLYQQLYMHMRQAILSSELKGGTKLPSTRALADELGVSRNTVLNAYEQLAAEGYLESSEGSGTFVERVLPELLLTTPRRKSRAARRCKCCRRMAAALIANWPLCRQPWRFTLVLEYK